MPGGWVRKGGEGWSRIQWSARKECSENISMGTEGLPSFPRRGWELQCSTRKSRAGICNHSYKCKWEKWNRKPHYRSKANAEKVSYKPPSTQEGVRASPHPQASLPHTCRTEDISMKLLSRHHLKAWNYIFASHKNDWVFLNESLQKVCIYSIKRIFDINWGNLNFIILLPNQKCNYRLKIWQKFSDGFFVTPRRICTLLAFITLW